MGARELTPPYLQPATRPNAHREERLSLFVGDTPPVVLFHVAIIQFTFPVEKKLLNIFSVLTRENPYGEGYEIQRLDDVNHANKRMGTASIPETHRSSPCCSFHFKQNSVASCLVTSPQHRRRVFDRRNYIEGDGQNGGLEIDISTRDILHEGKKKITLCKCLDSKQWLLATTQQQNLIVPSLDINNKDS